MSRQNDLREPEHEEVRAYILTMVAQLAEMADKIQDAALADHLRFVVWPSRTRGLFSDGGPR